MQSLRSLRHLVGKLRSIHSIADSGLHLPFRAAEAQSNLPLRTGRDRLVVLGTGWAGARLVKDIDPQKYDITVLSPRNHLVFTPLLSSCCVGTLESRAVTLAIVDLQKALKKPYNYYYTADCISVDPHKKVVEALSADGLKFFVDYDVLAIATGSQGSTFGIPGVEEHAHFLRDASHADNIRNTLLSNWNKANIPGRAIADRDRLLHTVVVGGGPTGVEFAGELADFVRRDLQRIDPDRGRDVRITLIEANELLGSFDARLREYAVGKLVKEGVHLLKAVVKEVRKTEIELTNGQIIPFGLCVWSTGVGPTKFTLSLPFVKTPKGRLAIDESLHVLMPFQKKVAGTGGDGDGGKQIISEHIGPTEMSQVNILTDEEQPVDGQITQDGALGIPVPDVYAMGDCCANAQSPLPALAQVAEQQGKFLARVLNRNATAGGGGKKVNQGDDKNIAVAEKFVYKSLGSMAQVGGASAILELQRSPGRGNLSVAGFSSFVAWRSAYLTRLGTMKARLFVFFNWSMTLLFGRDISRW
jgi:NADH:ubiquinone reductase (non-electrogenic)